jgi:adenosylhomocysteinase
VKDWKGVSEETTTGVHRLYQMLEAGKLLVPAINVNDSVTKSKFDNLYGCRESLARRHQARHRRHDRRQVASSAATAMSAKAAPLPPRLRRRGSSSPRSIPSTPSRPHGRLRVMPIEDTLGQGDIYVTTTGNCDVITLEHMAQDEGPGHRLQHRPLRQRDSGGQAQHAEGREESVNIKPQVDRYTFPAAQHLSARRRPPREPRLRHRPPELRDEQQLHQPVLAQIDLWETKDTYKSASTVLPKKLDEEVARLHLDKIGVKLTKLTKDQADYIGVPVEGPYKPEHYRYRPCITSVGSTRTVPVCCC